MVSPIGYGTLVAIPLVPYPTTLGGGDYRFSDALATLDPIPACDLARVTHTRLRRRLLYGMARADAKARVMERLKSIERADAWGAPDETGNLFPAGCKMLAQLYTPEPPRPTGPRGTEAVVEAATQGGLWDLLIRGQRDCIGMREWLVRVDPVEDPKALLGHSLMYRPVFADRVVAAPRLDCCDLPGYIAESVWLAIGDEPARWYWDVWCINGPAYHELRTDLGTGGRVVARDDVYPYHDEDGIPVLPYSLYHAERTGFLWDPYEWMEAVEGSLELVAKLTFYGHVVFKAAWAQRWSVGVDWGGSVRDEDDNHDGASRPRTSIAADPAVVLNGVPADVGEGATPFQVGQWTPPVDPEVLIRSIAIYERRVMRAMGIEEVDVTKASADPRSGYALEVDSTKQDAMRLRFLPTFLRGDVETLRVSAAVLGSAAGVAIPTTGWTIEYGPEEDVADEGAAVGPEGKPVAAVADTALNGAQVTALIQIVSDVAAGLIPRDAAIAIAQRAFQVSAEEAANLLGSAGNGFVQTAPPAPTGGFDGGRGAGGREGTNQGADGGAGRGEGGGSGGTAGGEGGG